MGNKREVCDKCGSQVIEGKCDCGQWFNNEEKPEFVLLFERAMIAYNNMNIDSPISGSHFDGTCIVLFKGDYELCEKVKDFIIEEAK